MEWGGYFDEFVIFDEFEGFIEAKSLCGRQLKGIDGVDAFLVTPFVDIIFL
jgi:hypothetical protein